MKWKKLIATTLATALISTNAFAANITINGNNLQSDTSPVIANGRTLVPVRHIFESLGATVSWDSSTKTITAIRGTTNIELVLNQSTAVVNGNSYTLDVPPQIIDGRTMVPARFIAENLNCNVSWDATTQTVVISELDATQSNIAEKQTTTTTNTPADSADEKGKTVYITRTGKKYHYDSTCNGGNYFSSTLDEALAMGLTPCSKCVH
ncbi:copper amine oxidase N-terminal domain-containing protein [Anaerotignum sp. MB30-C6]|uniref:copper amine oxidase N-terminal domain-containing protein n=1 Tax=Anaerotignum sp. MB30-C6 TaxID=3070814 RepID=UPI0027DD58FD|nr:copper amine oxidase N-terminal domain-containing protein [Anaerotignum sp. MB30-C6]WMI82063.1 copper amine oxidase N-terminal domain-containing protein [Anaerotignum sp. MB30-C6]